MRGRVTECHVILDIVIYREIKMYQLSYENITQSEYLTFGQSIDSEISTIHFKSLAFAIFGIR